MHDLALSPKMSESERARLGMSEESRRVGVPKKPWCSSLAGCTSTSSVVERLVARASDHLAMRRLNSRACFEWGHARVSNRMTD